MLAFLFVLALAAGFAVYLHSRKTGQSFVQAAGSIGGAIKSALSRPAKK